MTELAISKIKKELAEAKGAGQKEKAVSKPVADALIEFSKQDKEFAQAIVQNDKTLSDCLKSVMSGVGNAISDIEVYKKAVQFYFPGADVRFHMTVDLCASVNDGTESEHAENSTKLDIDLTDFL